MRKLELGRKIRKGFILFFLVFVLPGPALAKTSSRPVARGNGLEIRTIIIDPGHGGKDPGAVGRRGLKEKQVVLDIAKRLKRILDRDRNLKVYLTRSRDRFVPLSKRASFANRRKGGIFLSIHANSAFTSRARGFETYYLSQAVDDTARAAATRENSVLKLEEFEGLPKARRNNSNLETILWDMKYTEFRNQSMELAELIQKRLSRTLKIRNRGVKSAPFYVLKKVAMPSILVEVGFMSNRRDEALLRDANFREKIARALAESILSYRRIYKKEKGFTK